MIKRLYLANGTLQTALSKSSEDIAVDATTATYILSVLGIGDWAYLTLEYMGLVEVVKVYLNYSGLNVDRAQDGTKREGFPAGATVIYKLTQAEIQDATPASTVNIYAALTGYIDVTVSGSTTTISYPYLTVQGNGGIRGYFTTIDATLYLDSWYPAAGCLSIAGNGAPLIGGPDFYVTSQPYPVLVVDEYMAANPQNLENPGTGDFGFGPLWTLTQPMIYDGYMQSSAGLGMMNVFGSEGSFSVTDAYMAAQGGTVNSINVYGTQGSFTVSDTGYMQGGAYPLQMLIFGSEVEYNYGVDKYMQGTAIVNSVTVA